MFVSNPTISPKAVRVVLFILDQDDVPGLWEITFQEKGFTTLHERPEDALQTCRVVDPVLNVVDINVTHENRLAFCSRLRANASGPILLLVPDYDSNKLNDFYDTGVDECLLQPVSPAFLGIKAISWLLKRRWLGTDANLPHVYTRM